MKIQYWIKRLALLVAVVLVVAVALPSTMAYIVTETNSIVNTFVPPSGVAVTVTVSKTVNNTGELTMGPEGFAFVLQETASGETQQLRTDADGKAVYTLTMSAADVGKTHTYTLREVDEGKAGVTYDRAVHTIEVAVTQRDDELLTAAVTLDGRAVDACVVAFENTYHANKEPSPPTGEDVGAAGWLMIAIISGVVCAAAAWSGCRRNRRKGAE